MIFLQENNLTLFFNSTPLTIIINLLTVFTLSHANKLIPRIFIFFIIYFFNQFEHNIKITNQI